MSELCAKEKINWPDSVSVYTKMYEVFFWKIKSDIFFYMYGRLGKTLVVIM